MSAAEGGVPGEFSLSDGGDSAVRDSLRSWVSEALDEFGPGRAMKALFRTEGGIGVDKLREEHGLTRSDAMIVDGLAMAAGASGFPAAGKILVGLSLKARGVELESDGEEAEVEEEQEATEEEVGIDPLNPEGNDGE